MSETATPMRYLEQAMNKLHDLGLLPPENDNSASEPIVGLLNQISALDEAKVTAIARTLSQASTFNEVVREQVRAMEVGERYNDITQAFNSIRDDARSMVAQVEDGKIDTFERLGNIWMKVTRGDIASRFDTIKDTYLDVTASTKDQIEREQTILDAYMDFRGALKESEVLALEVLKTATDLLEGAKSAVGASNEAVTNYEGDDMAERAKSSLLDTAETHGFETDFQAGQISAMHRARYEKEARKEVEALNTRYGYDAIDYLDQARAKLGYKN